MYGSTRGMSRRIAACEVGNSFYRPAGQGVVVSTSGNEGFGARIARSELPSVRAVEKVEMRFQRVGLLVRQYYGMLGAPPCLISYSLSLSLSLYLSTSLTLCLTVSLPPSLTHSLPRSRDQDAIALTQLIV